MDDGSIYWGYITSISSSLSWMATPQFHKRYSVIMNLGNGVDRETPVNRYLQYLPMPRHERSDHHLPKKAKILYLDNYSTKSEFEIYKYDDPEANEELRIWITIPGSTNVMTAKLEKLDILAKPVVHEAVLKVWEEEYDRKHGTQPSTSG